jgi:hypothetical protein
MKPLSARRLLPGGADWGRRPREPRALDLILAITAVVLLAAGCLRLLAALAP